MIVSEDKSKYLHAVQHNTSVAVINVSISEIMHILFPSPIFNAHAQTRYIRFMQTEAIMIALSTALRDVS